MKTPPFFAALLLPLSSAFAAEPIALDINVRDIPVGTSEVVVLIDTAPAPERGYDDPAPPPAAAAVQQVIQQVQAPAANQPAPPAAAPAAATPEEQQRRRRRTAAAVAVPAIRESIDPKGSATATVRVQVPPGDNYKARVIALRADGSLPAILAGAHADSVKVAAGRGPVDVALTTPTLRLAPTNPTTVAPGARYQLAATISDAARALGNRNRMRIWISEGTPPTANYAGRQTSTVDVTTEGADVKFTFDLVAPNQPTTLFFQFGELPPDFARTDGSQAAFLVLPNLATGASALQLQVK